MYVKKLGRRSELYTLPPAQQIAIRLHCERIRLTEGVKWLKRDFRIEVSESTLRVWLCRKRAEGGHADVRKPSGTLYTLPARQQKTLFAYCEKYTLAQGVEWIERKLHLKVSPASLSRWLARQRVARGSKLDRKPQGNATLALLSPEQTDLLFEACDSGTLEDGRTWVWENLGVDISRSSICTWRNQERAKRSESAKPSEVQ